MPREVLTRAAPPPSQVLRYGTGEDHVADLRMPPPPTPPAPLVIFLHGGFWRAEFDRSHTGPLGAALAEAGFVVCAPEFRRTGQPGGGWPGTFDDVAAAVDRLPGLVRKAVGPGAVSEGPVILAGHSAGGHLALWAAAREGRPSNATLRSGCGPSMPGRKDAGPLPPVRGVVALAAVSDLRACHAQGLGQGAAGDLLGGGPDDQPARYRAVDPAQSLPIGCPVRLVHGTADDRVPAGMSREFTAAGHAAGDEMALDELPGADHFDVIDPLSTAWPAVLAAFLSLALPGEMPAG